MSTLPVTPRATLPQAQGDQLMVRGARHVIASGPAFIDIETLASGPRIVADTTRPGTFAVAEARRIDVLVTFAVFTAKVAEKLAGGSKAVNLSANGDHNAATGDFSARTVLLEQRPAK